MDLNHTSQAQLAKAELANADASALIAFSFINFISFQLYLRFHSLIISAKSKYFILTEKFDSLGDH